MRASERPLIAWLEDIATAAATVVRHTEALSFADFCNNELVLAVVLLNVQIMGEASAYVLQYFPDYLKVTPLPWAGMRLMRNRLMHGYSISTSRSSGIPRGMMPPTSWRALGR